MPEQLLTVRQACERLGLSKAYLYQLMRRGAGPVSLKIGTKRMFREASLDDWVLKQQSRAA